MKPNLEYIGGPSTPAEAVQKIWKLTRPLLKTCLPEFLLRVRDMLTQNLASFTMPNWLKIPPLYGL